jgi:hypothetical protein
LRERIAALQFQPLVYLVPSAIPVPVHLAFAILRTAALTVDEALGAVGNRADATRGVEITLPAGIAGAVSQCHTAPAMAIHGIASGIYRQTSGTRNVSDTRSVSGISRVCNTRNVSGASGAHVASNVREGLHPDAARDGDNTPCPLRWDYLRIPYCQGFIAEEVKRHRARYRFATRGRKIRKDAKFRLGGREQLETLGAGDKEQVVLAVEQRIQLRIAF